MRIAVVTFMLWWFAEASGGTLHSSFEVSGGILGEQRVIVVV